LPTFILLFGTFAFTGTLYFLWWRITHAVGTALVATVISLIVIVAASTVMHVLVTR